MVCREHLWLCDFVPFDSSEIFPILVNFGKAPSTDNLYFLLFSNEYFDCCCLASQSAELSTARRSAALLTAELSSLRHQLAEVSDSEISARQQLDAAHLRIEKICAAKKSAELECRREAEAKSADAVAEAVEEGKRALLAEKNLARTKLAQVRNARWGRDADFLFIAKTTVLVFCLGSSYEFR